MRQTPFPSSSKLITAVLLTLLLLTNCQQVSQTTNTLPTLVPTSPPACTNTTNPTTRTVETAIPVYGFQIINTYPHDPDAFTQGLEYAAGDLIEGTGLYGRSTLRRVDLETGQILQQTEEDLTAYFGEGITTFQNRIYQLTWKSQIAIVYDIESLERLQTFSYETQGWGLTHDGSCLIMSDGSNMLTFRDPNTFAMVAQLPVLAGSSPITRLNELEFVDGEIYANIWQQNRIVRISPETGQVVGWILLDELAAQVNVTDVEDVLNGIAYDVENGRLFVTGKRWPTLFEIKLQLIEPPNG